MDLKPGDVVMLKSGGHPLSVVEVKDGNVACVWMGNEGDLFRETLPLAVLDLAEHDTRMTKRKTTKKTMRTKTKRASTTARPPKRISTSPGIHRPATSFPGIGPGAEDLIFAANRPQLPAVDSAGSEMAVKR